MYKFKEKDFNECFIRTNICC